MFEVLAEPHRRRILDLLREQDQAVGDLVSALGLSQPGVSKHLRALREAGLVEVRADAQRRVYRLRTEPLREIDEWLAPYRAAWAGRLPSPTPSTSSARPRATALAGTNAWIAWSARSTGRRSGPWVRSGSRCTPGT